MAHTTKLGIELDSWKYRLLGAANVVFGSAGIFFAAYTINEFPGGASTGGQCVVALAVGTPCILLYIALCVCGVGLIKRDFRFVRLTCITVVLETSYWTAIGIIVTAVEGVPIKPTEYPYSLFGLLTGIGLQMILVYPLWGWFIVRDLREEQKRATNISPSQL